jgi:hypothetical protein
MAQAWQECSRRKRTARAGQQMSAQVLRPVSLS